MDSIQALIGELQGADAERQRAPRGTEQYEEAAARVERLDRAVWRAVQTDRDPEDGAPSSAQAPGAW